MPTRDPPKHPPGEPTEEAAEAETHERPARFSPFANDAAVQTIGGLAIENGIDRIAIHGTLDLTRDAPGLARARALLETLAAIVAALEAKALPARSAEANRPATTVTNPFA